MAQTVRRGQLVCTICQQRPLYLPAMAWPLIDCRTVFEAVSGNDTPLTSRRIYQWKNGHSSDQADRENPGNPLLP